MESENRLREIDRHVIEALDPDEAVIRRVVSFGLQERQRGHRWRGGVAMAVAITAGLAVAIGSAFHWRWPTNRPATRAELTITGTGSSITVERSDGQRWFFGNPPAPDAAGGSYVIVVPAQGALK